VIGISESSRSIEKIIFYLEGEMEVVDKFKKFYLILQMHFPGVNVQNIFFLKCESCEDFKIKACEGKNLTGGQVVDCMWDKIDHMSVSMENYS